jgi:hypothetical protein
MKLRTVVVVIVFLSFFCLPLSFAGFQDFLNDTMRALGKDNALSEDEIVSGLKEALEIGTANAVKLTGAKDGYLENPRIRIPLPENVEKAESILRTTGLGRQVDDFELSMNRAAERAAPKAQSIFQDAIRQMTFSDAKQILNGGDHAATSYFEDKTSDSLRKAFQPDVHQAMAEVGVTRTYQDLNDKASKLPFVDDLAPDLDQYVTDKALDGLFLMLAEEEKKIRQDPAARVTDLLKKVFSSN